MAQTYYHRAFHALTTSYVYWNSEIPQDDAGEYYTGDKPFNELSEIVMIRLIPVEGEGAFYESAEQTNQLLNEFYPPGIYSSIAPLVVETSVAEVEANNTGNTLWGTSWSTPQITTYFGNLAEPGFITAADGVIVAGLEQANGPEAAGGFPPDGGAQLWSYDGGGANDQFAGNRMHAYDGVQYVYVVTLDTDGVTSDIVSLAKLDKDTGVAAWDIDITPDDSDDTPYDIRYYDNHVYLVTRAGEVRKIQASDGVQVADYELGITSIGGIGIFPNQNTLVVLDRTNDFVRAYPLDQFGVTTTPAELWSIDLVATAGANFGADDARSASDRTNDVMYFIMGGDGTPDSEVLVLDVAGQALLSNLQPAVDGTITSDLADINLDQYNHLYICSWTGSAGHIHRYNDAQVYVTDTGVQGISITKPIMGVDVDVTTGAIYFGTRDASDQGALGVIEQGVG